MVFWNKICGFILISILSCLFSNAQITTSIKLNYINFLVKNKLKASDTTFHFIPLSFSQILKIQSHRLLKTFLHAHTVSFAGKKLKLKKQPGCLFASGWDRWRNAITMKAKSNNYFIRDLNLSFYIFASMLKYPLRKKSIPYLLLPVLFFLPMIVSCQVVTDTST